MDFDAAWLKWVSLFANGAGVIGALSALGAWWHSRQTNRRLDAELARQNELIKVELSNGTDTIEVPVPIRRSEFSRAEVMGRIGMLSGGDRFDLADIRKERFFKRFDEILTSSGPQTLVISCAPDEFEKFKKPGK